MQLASQANEMREGERGRGRWRKCGKKEEEVKWPQYTSEQWSLYDAHATTAAKKEEEKEQGKCDRSIYEES